jgi:hypothetical protein
MRDFEDRYGDECEAPFDPHDLRYYLSTSGIHKEMHREVLTYPPNGVDVDLVKENVMWMDDKGDESIKRKHIPYLKTHRDYKCGRWEHV